jgi:hypothetical protein
MLTLTAPLGFIPGRTFSIDHKNKLKGIPKTQEQKQKQSVSMIGKPGLSGDSNPAKRFEVREKISKTLTGKKRPKKQCEYCKKEIADSVYTKHHGNKCKLKTE